MICDYNFGVIVRDTTKKAKISEGI